MLCKCSISCTSQCTEPESQTTAVDVLSTKFIKFEKDSACKVYIRGSVHVTCAIITQKGYHNGICRSFDPQEFIHRERLSSYLTHSYRFILLICRSSSFENEKLVVLLSGKFYPQFNTIFSILYLYFVISYYLLYCLVRRFGWSCGCFIGLRWFESKKTLTKERLWCTGP